MNYKKIKPKKIYEEVADTIHDMIKEGQFKPGDKLDSVQQLAENFQVGRSTIREALTALRAMGLIEIKQGEGTYVKEFESEQVSLPLSTAILMNLQDTQNLLEVRKILEAGTCFTASQKRTEQDLQTIETALKEMQLASGNEELNEKADLAFHMSIAEATQNPLLVNLMNHVSGLIGETIRETRRLWLFSEQISVDRLYEEHYKIYLAIKDKDGEKARALMLDHLEKVESVLYKYLK